MKSLKQKEQLQSYIQSMESNMTNLEKIWSRIGSVSKQEVIRCVLLDEIEIHKKRLQPHDTGHLHTAIFVIESRLEEIDPYSG